MIISIDPGFSKSGSGVTLYNETTKTVVFSEFIPPQLAKVKKGTADPFWKRMKKVVRCVEDLKHEHPNAVVVIESGFYPGLANVTHQRTIGVFMFLFDCQTLSPLTVKKLVTGSGKSDKAVVTKSIQLCVETACEVDWSNEDVTDSIAIAVAWSRKV